MFRNIKLYVLVIFGFSAIYNIYSAISVSAYSASISTSGTINLEVSASGNSANVATDNVKVTSTCPLGYTLSIQGPTNTTLYKDGNKTNNSDNSKIIPTAGTEDNPLPIIGDDGSGNSYLGTWGYAIDSGTGINFSSNFIGLTNTMTTLTSSTDATAATGTTIPVYYGASVSPTTEPGQYKLSESTAGANDNVITYYLTTSPNCDNLYIRYNDNGANSTTKMGNQQISANATEVVPWASNFQRSGYGFAGWSLEALELDPEEDDINNTLAAARANGLVMGPNQTIDGSTDPSIENLFGHIKAENGNLYIDLYAIWIPSEGNIQNWNGCKNMEVGEVTALTDTRDNDTYAIAKLADENCWMIENLRLGSTTAMTLTPSDSNISSNFTLPASTDPTVTEWCVDNVDSSCIDQSMLYASGKTDTVSNMTTADANAYSYGNYYNWYSATAGTGTYSLHSGEATSSICPKGWHLPTGNSSGEFYELNATANYDSTSSDAGLKRYPNNFVYSGQVDWNELGSRGEFGVYHSSTADGMTSYSLIFTSYLVSLDNDEAISWGHNGRTVRCVADADEPVTIEKAYEKAGMTKQDGYYKMQDMNDSICGAVNVLDEEGQTQLIDARDNKVYWATKLQDGHCWMTQNLDLNLSTSVTLTHDDTDLGWGSDTTTTSWVPVRSTIDASSVTNNYISDWRSDNNTPYSTDPGNVYWNAFPFYASTENNFLNNDWGSDPVKFQKDTPFEGNGTHGHVGNYYNWSAAVASNDTSAYTSSTYDNIANNPQNSICPAGWRLPTMSNASNTTESSTNEFSRLNYLYNSNATNTSEKLESAPLYFARSGYIYGGQNYVGYGSFYQSSTVYSSNFVYYSVSYSSQVVMTSGNYRNYGITIRCLAR